MIEKPPTQLQFQHSTQKAPGCWSLLGGLDSSIKKSRLSLEQQRSSNVGGSENDSTILPLFPTALLKGEIIVKLQLIIIQQQQQRLQINEKNHKILMHFRDNLLHTNVVRFLGYTLMQLAVKNSDKNSDSPPTLTFEQYFLWEHCEKGSLEELIEKQNNTTAGDTSFKLDTTFEYALLLDVAQGMAFLHKHAPTIGAHMQLHPSVCLIDKRFSVKIAEYGASVLLGGTLFGRQQQGSEGGEQQHQLTMKNEKRLYLAPEILRKEKNDLKILMAADVYAYSMLMYTMLTRSAPFESDVYNGEAEGELTIDRVLEQIAATPAATPPLRPALTTLDNNKLVQLLCRCWAQHPSERPLFTEVVQQLTTLSGTGGGKNSSNSITEQLLRRLERYAGDMESLVAERTRELENEQRRSDELLNRMLPAQVATELKKNGQVQPETFDAVTIYFSDIVGFTTISSESSPIQVVTLLNALYTMFDAKIDLFDAYKLETIGDAYMVVSGLPNRNGNQHCVHIARLALALLNGIKSFSIPHRPDEKLRLRIGLHTGPCVAGVVGIKMPRYCLFGDTVNTASRMESTGAALRIHISNSLKIALTDDSTDKASRFETEERGPLEVKGKGVMITHWLLSEI